MASVLTLVAVVLAVANAQMMFPQMPNHQHQQMQPQQSWPTAGNMQPWMGQQGQQQANPWMGQQQANPWMGQQSGQWNGMQNTNQQQQQPQWIQTPFGSSITIIRNAPITWTAARQLCQQQGADLLILEDKQKSHWVKQLMSSVARGRAIWLGLTYQPQSGWTWINGQPAKNTDWSPNEPNVFRLGRFPTCVLLGANYQWWDDACWFTHPEIDTACEKTAAPTGGMPGGMTGGMPGGMTGGMQGGMTGGMPGGMTGGMPGGMTGGMPGGMTGGMPGGMTGGMPGGMTGGMQGGMTGGMPGGMTGALPGGMQGGQPSSDSTQSSDDSAGAAAGDLTKPTGVSTGKQ